MNREARDITGWIPYRVFWDDPSADSPVLAAELCDLRGIRPVESFFENTLQRAMKEPFRVLFRQRISLNELADRLETLPLVPPTGFILHMSRCGSTLVSRMLAASDRNLVISEGWAIDSALHCIAQARDADEKLAARWLRTVICASGQQPWWNRTGAARYFVKFDAWHALALPLIRKTFPETPWVFLYREPVEVMISQLKQPASWASPGLLGSGWSGISTAEAAMMPFGSYLGRLLLRICRTALENSRNGGLLLNYNELPGALFDRIASHYQCNFHRNEIAVMDSVARLDAKDPRYFFEPDSEAKQRECLPAVREMAQKWLADVYSELEKGAVSRSFARSCI